MDKKKEERDVKKWMVTFESDSKDSAKEDEFNKWYNEIHLPDVLETKGVVKATRYERRDPREGQRKFLAVYEIEADDLDAVLAAVKDNIEAKAEQGRMSDLLDGERGGEYIEIYSVESS